MGGGSFTLPDPAMIATVPHEHLPALLAQLAVLQAAVAARLATTPPPPPPPRDRERRHCTRCARSRTSRSTFGLMDAEARTQVARVLSADRAGRTGGVVSSSTPHLGSR